MPAQRTIKTDSKQIAKLQKRPEDTLRESEKKYRDLVELMNDGLSTTDENFVFTFANRKFAEMLGYLPSEIIGRHITEFLDDENKEVMERQIATRKQGGESKYVITWTTKAGGKVDTLISPRAFFDENGNYTGSLGILTDITEQKRVEEELRASEEKYRTLAESSPDAIFIQNPDGEYLYINSTGAAFLGKKPDEIIGKNTVDIFPKQVIEHVLGKIRYVLDNNRPISFKSSFSYNKKPRYFSTTLSPIQDDNGNLVSLLGVAHDITDRELAAQQIAGLAKFPSENPYPVLRIKADGTILYSNDTGFALLNKWRRNIGELAPKDWYRLITEVIELNCNKIVEVKCKNRVFSFTIAPITEAGYVNLYGIDITERKQAEEDLRRYQHHLEDLVESRTAKLVKANRQLLQEIEQRKYLEKEILDISEREQRKIGQELHDSIGQQFAGIAFMTKVLEKKLAKKLPEEAATVAEIGKLVSETTVQARGLAKGLYPVDLSAVSFISALHELADTTKRLFGVNCDVECDDLITVQNSSIAVHLYRITQEAINNAIKHGKTKNIVIGLSCNSKTAALTIQSDGVDLPEVITRDKGMGLHIIEHRVDLIGGLLDIRKNPNGGTIVTCVFANAAN